MLMLILKTIFLWVLGFRLWRDIKNIRCSLFSNYYEVSTGLGGRYRKWYPCTFIVCLSWVRCLKNYSHCHHSCYLLSSSLDQKDVSKVHSLMLFGICFSWHSFNIYQSIMVSVSQVNIWLSLWPQFTIFWLFPASQTGFTMRQLSAVQWTL